MHRELHRYPNKSLKPACKLSVSTCMKKSAAQGLIIIRGCQARLLTETKQKLHATRSIELVGLLRVYVSGLVCCVDETDRVQDSPCIEVLDMSQRNQGIL